MARVIRSGLRSGHLLSLADSRYVLVEPPHHVAPRHRHEPILYSFGGSVSINQRTKKSQRRRIM